MLYITSNINHYLYTLLIIYIIAIHRVVFADCCGTGLVPQSDATYHINWQLHLETSDIYCKYEIMTCTLWGCFREVKHDFLATWSHTGVNWWSECLKGNCPVNLHHLPFQYQAYGLYYCHHQFTRFSKCKTHIDCIWSPISYSSHCDSNHKTNIFINLQLCRWKFCLSMTPFICFTTVALDDMPSSCQYISIH